MRRVYGFLIGWNGTLTVRLTPAGQDPHAWAKARGCCAILGIVFCVATWWRQQYDPLPSALEPTRWDWPGIILPLSIGLAANAVLYFQTAYGAQQSPIALAVFYAGEAAVIAVLVAATIHRFRVRHEPS